MKIREYLWENGPKPAKEISNDLGILNPRQIGQIMRGHKWFTHEWTPKFRVHLYEAKK